MLLTRRFSEDDHKVYGCVEDADSKIIEVAVDKAKSTEVMIIVNDSDFAIASCYCITGKFVWYLLQPRNW